MARTQLQRQFRALKEAVDRERSRVERQDSEAPSAPQPVAGGKKAKK